MNLSFIATIGFAYLAIFLTFTANLTVLVYTASRWHVAGVALAIVAAGASYWAQNLYTVAGYHRENDSPLSNLGTAADKCEAWGSAVQVLAVVLIVLSVAGFVKGMWR